MTMSQIATIVLAIEVALLILPEAHAADIELSDNCSLADAITAANTDTAVGGCLAGDGADTITLSGDIMLTAALPHITSEVTIDGAGYMISGNNRYRVFAVNGGNLSVNNLTITKGNADWGGAVINVNGGILLLSNCEIYESHASEGGAIGNDATLSVMDCEISRNAAEYGGAIHSGNGTVNTTNTLISRNSGKSGGAIYIEGGESTISDSIVAHNEAEGSGGAIYLKEKGAITITSSVLERNISGGLGGAIYCWPCTAHIADSRLQYNLAENGGGAIFDFDGEEWITDSIISHNTVKPGGRTSEGGAMESSGVIRMTRSVVAHNRADFGGGIHTVGGFVTGASIFENSLFVNNVANEHGGALYVDDGNVVLIHLTLVGNQAELGGGIYRHTDATVRMRNSIVSSSKGSDCYGRIEEKTGSLSADGSCLTFQVGEPILGELVEPEDGSLPYYPLLEGSPAIDVADDEYCPDTDIIDTPRSQGAGCDIGAYELPVG